MKKPLHYRLQAAKKNNLCSTRMGSELLLVETDIRLYGHRQGLVTFTPINEHLSVDLPIPI